MQLFCETRRGLQLLGLSLSESNTASTRNKWHKIAVFICIAQMPVSTFSYLLYGTRDANDFFECAYVFVCSITVTGCFIALWWDNAQLTKFVASLESMTSKSNYPEYVLIQSEKFRLNSNTNLNKKT